MPLATKLNTILPALQGKWCSCFGSVVLLCAVWNSCYWLQCLWVGMQTPGDAECRGAVAEPWQDSCQPIGLTLSCRGVGMQRFRGGSRPPLLPGADGGMHCIGMCVSSNCCVAVCYSARMEEQGCLENSGSPVALRRKPPPCWNVNMKQKS